MERPYYIPRTMIPPQLPLTFSATPTAAPAAETTHKPFLASLASVSSPSNTTSPGAYFRYHQHQPSLTSRARWQQRQSRAGHSVHRQAICRW
jgi:hypothetical protein